MDQIFSSDLKIKQEDLNLIFKDILSLSSSFDEFLAKASVQDLIQALKVTDDKDYTKIDSIKKALDNIEDITANEYCDIAKAFNKKKIQKNAVEYYHKALDKDPKNITALEELGTRYMTGNGCEVDKAKGLHYLKQAFQENHFQLFISHGTITPNPATKLMEFYANNPTLEGSKNLSMLYQNYLEQLQHTLDGEKQKLYNNFQRAELAATLDIENATGEQLLSAIEAYEQQLMGLSDPNKEIVKKLGAKLFEISKDENNRTFENIYYQGICYFYGYGCKPDLNTASFLLEKVRTKNSDSPKIASLLSKCYEKVGGDAKKRSAIVYHTYSQKLQQTSDREQQKVLYKDFQRAENAATLLLTSATKEELQSAITSYKEGLMGLSIQDDSDWYDQLNDQLKKQTNS